MISYSWWHKPITSVLKRLRQEDTQVGLPRKTQFQEKHQNTHTHTEVIIFLDLHC